ncbi:MAG: ATP-binding protein [Bacteroidota bacterium]
MQSLPNQHYKQLSPSTDAETIQRQWATIHRTHPYEAVSFGYLLTAPDRKIVNINDTLLNWIEYKAEEVVGQKIFQDLLNVDSKIYYETHQAALDNLQGASQEISYTLRSKNGHCIDVFVNSKQYRNQYGELLFSEIFLFNFPERKKYEQELLKAKKLAESISDAKTNFISSVSHEIRTPINAIMGVSDLLMSNVANSEQLELLNTLQFAAKNLMELINDVLDFSKLEQEKMVLHPVHFNLRKTLRYILGSFYPKINHHRVKLQLEIDEAIPEWILGDKIRIVQIINNLVNNAVKFTHDGHVALTVRLKERTHSKLSIYFAISDTGIGMTTEQRTRIFESFHQADTSIASRYGGTGLGLSITKQLIELHESTLYLDSEAGKGSTFHFILPLQIGAAKGHEAKTAPQATIVDLSNMRVLLVEDHPSNTLIASRFFDRWKLKYDCVTNGKEAIKKVTQYKYDLVLMDLNMPVMDGITATHSIRQLAGEQFQTLPIVAMSAATESEVKSKLEQVGITHYIMKPFVSADLLSQLKAFQPVSTVHEYLEIDFSWLYDLFENDSADLLHYLSILIVDWQQASINLRASIDRRNTTNYAAIIHQVSPTMKLLHIDELLILLETGKLQIDQPDTFARTAYFKNVLDYFDRLVSVLHQEKERLDRQKR